MISFFDSNLYINAYGPTEATINATVYCCTNHNEQRIVPIGKPLPNYKAYIVDKNLKPVPIGMKGELYISGVGVARGYLNREDLTKEKFIENPFMQGSRMYKTGDIARWLTDGNIEFLGRDDLQIKIRGFRVELGEIEAQLVRHEAIDDAIVIYKNETLGSPSLQAYYVSKQELKVNDIREHLLKELPEYMVPTNYMGLDKFPLTINGKVDRNNLPQFMDLATEDTDLNDNEIMGTLYQIWKEVLGRGDIRKQDNFFEIGGNSFSLVHMKSRIEDMYPNSITTENIILNPSISTLSKIIEDRSNFIFDNHLNVI